MARAIRLARAGLGSTYPNPSVGAVLVRRGKVVGTGRSDPAGGPHAEVKALRVAGTAAKGASLYVTLEPCCHVGRTGPCTDAIIESGVKRVVVGVRDPAQHVDGKGLARLRRAGVEVEVGVLAQACEAVHQHYLHHERTARPFVSLKAAVSLDGCIATPSGDSKWITGERARAQGHRLRARHHGIAVGVQTVLTDDPSLDVRWVRGADPVPIIFDSRLRLGRPKVRRKLLREGTWVLHTPVAAVAARSRLQRMGMRLLEVPADPHGRVDVGEALDALGRLPLRSVLVEGGGMLLGAFVAAGLWEQLHLFQAPRLLGEGRRVIAGVSWDRVADAPAVQVVSRRKLGEDLLTVLAPREQRPSRRRTRRA